MASFLIIDDDLDIAEMVCTLLQEAGHFVRKAHTGEEGLRVLRAAQLPDCILLDVDMPVLTGPQMAHRMLLHDAGKEHVPIVLLSGRADLPAIAKSIGTPYFLAKPCDEQVLLDLLDRAVRERVAPSSAGLKEEPAVSGDERARASPQREITDENLRDERGKADNARKDQRAVVEHKADEIVQRARNRADAVLSSARHEEASAGPVTKEMRADSRRKGQAADVVTTTERAIADNALRKERTENRRTLDGFLEAERALTDTSLEDERLHADVTVTSRDEFLGMVSHDLRNLLGGVGLTVSQIAKSAAPGEDGVLTKKWVTSIQRLLGRMTRLIGDLLDVTSIEAGKLRVDVASVDARKVVCETLDAFAEIAKARGITLELEDGAINHAPLDASFDADRIMQVMANLVGNAIKFTQAGGSIVICVEQMDDAVHFSVTDNGPGIPSELLTTVFERYRQIRADRRGLGLGLYISKCIVEAHGGTIWAESQLGQGSTFHFTIPNAVEDFKAYQPQPSPSAQGAFQ